VAAVSIPLSDSICVKNTVSPGSVRTNMSGSASSAQENNLWISENVTRNRFHCRH
jgi:hypothetical protein